MKIFDIEGCRIRKSEIKLKNSDRDSDKLGYKHYMLKEIMEQPAAIRRTLSEIIGEKGRLKFRGIHITRAEIKAIDHVVFVACGSAYHAGKVGAYACERLFKRHSQAIIASEFRYMHPHLDEKTLVIIISQSGETADTLAAMRIAQERERRSSELSMSRTALLRRSVGTLFSPVRAGKSPLLRPRLIPLS